MNERQVFGADSDGVDRLLAFGLEGPGTVGQPPPAVDDPRGRGSHLASLLETPGSQIDRYTLLSVLGEGGMGIVYLAQQQEPIRRQVALKIIKPGMDSKRVLARFEAEQQALALMEHPHIARVYDAGLAPSGRPYFVMEPVKGLPITQHCDEQRLTIERRVHLFLHVCEAVQHAHQKGIIHRDLKPSNILVTVQDQEAIPKVIDFGIARALGEPLTPQALTTEQGQLLGTPEYMSPEQADPGNPDIDTQTDVYSLGVVLYELLAGVLPFDPEGFRTGGVEQICKVLCEKDPKTPSTWLSKTSAEQSAESARLRRTDVRALQRTLQGDLDWITLKALEKNRARRYSTVDSFATDLRNYLSHQPVSAAPPGTLYRVRKCIRRHGQAIAAAGTAAVLLVVLVWAVWTHIQVGQERAHARTLEHEKILAEAQRLFETGGLQAQSTAASSSDALAMIEPLLASRHVGVKAQLLFATILTEHRYYDEAMPRLQRLLDGPPEIAGTAYALLARILWESSALAPEDLKEIATYQKKAEELLPKTAEAYYLRAMTAFTIPEKLDWLREALRLDSTHYESRRLRALTYDASRKYKRLTEDALAMTLLRPGDPQGYSLRAAASKGLGDYEEALKHYDSAIERTAPDDPQYVDLALQQSEILLRMGNYERVAAEAQDAFQLYPGRPVFQYHLFAALTALGDFDKANAVFQDIVRASPRARDGFRLWAMKFVFDTLAAGQSWHPSGSAPAGAAFLPMVEAQETYCQLSAKAQRITTNGFSPQWSPKGDKLAFSLGVYGSSGVATFDPATKETELLIVPGKDPRWSPDGQYLAFVRDCEALRLEELATAGRDDRVRWPTCEEVWIMKSDGSEPRRLALGGWPSWSQDSIHVYYQSRLDSVLYSISIENRDAKPKPIMVCSEFCPSVSPDKQRVAYMEDSVLKVKRLPSQALVAEWAVPFTVSGGPAWSPTGHELGLTGYAERIGLWIYDLDGGEPVRTLSGHITGACWTGDPPKLAFSLGTPYLEIWAVDLDPNVSIAKALGPGQTPDEYFRRMVDFQSRRIKADPNDAYAYSSRAQYYDYLHERTEANADMKRWSDLNLSSMLQGFRCGEPANLGPAVNSSAHDGMLVMPTDGLSAFFDSDRSGEYASYNVWTAKWDAAVGQWGAAVNLGAPVNTDAWDGSPNISPDGLTLYFSSNRPGGSGDFDLWVTTRQSEDQPWALLENLGPTVNSPSSDGCPSISADGLELYFISSRPGGQGGYDLWVTTRTTTKDDWRPPVNLGTAINSPSDELIPSITTDGLCLFFCSPRPGGYGSRDIWVTPRATRKADWGPPVNPGPPLNSPYMDQGAILSPDGSTIFFNSGRPGGYGGLDIWQASIERDIARNGAPAEQAAGKTPGDTETRGGSAKR